MKPHRKTAASGKRISKTEIFVDGWNNLRECMASPHLKVTCLELKDRSTLNRIGKVPGHIKIKFVQDKPTHLPALHQGVGCWVIPPDWGDFSTFIDKLIARKPNPLILALDQVEDPNNLGQIIRTCEGVGVDAILLPDRRSVQLTQAVAQTSQGAFAWVPVLNVGNLRNALEEMKSKGIWVFASENHPKAKAWHQVDLKGPTALVLGSEGAGIRRLVLQTCDEMVHLPMAGRINSLNVGASAAAILFEAIRQRDVKD